MRKLLVVKSLMIFSCMAMAGTLSGTIKEKSTEITLPNARVSVLNTTFSTVANVDGVYSFNIPDGTYEVRVGFSGFGSETKTVTVSGDTKLDFDLVASSIEEEVVVTANRAVIRETPVAFTNVSGETIKERYTSQDTPELLKSVPGVFSRSSGLGESDLFVRGFDSERVQIMINNVPVNDPESQVVYWSNWTGLSGNAGSIQVQKGVGSSLYGSGAFGGSVNIETDNFKVEPSTGLLGTLADMSGNSHYVGAIDYSTGFIADDKFNFYGRYERKDGDSYIDQTTYDGHSFYLGTLWQVSDSQSWTINLHGAPQDHNQAANVQDPALLELFGRTWNRRNHPFQENYYFKPVFEAHHDWTIDSRSHWRSTIFVTKGTGGGRYLRNDRLNLETGIVESQPPGRRDNRFTDPFRDYTPARSMFNNSWRNDSQNKHDQWGANTSYKIVFNEKFTLVTGGEFRFWEADHFSDAEEFEYGIEDSVGLGPEVIDFVEKRYDYVGEVDNMSVFARGQFKPTEKLTVMVDVGFLTFDQKITENPIHQWDFYNRRWTDIFARATQDLSSDWDASGATTTANVIANPAADPDAYDRDYDFFQPKFGVNYNVDDNWNAFVNYSFAYKEPQVGDWYNRSSVPLTQDILDEESLTNLELGFGYRSRNMNLSVNYYVMEFEDKIESVTDSNGDRETINAGDADHTGLEVALNTQFNNNWTWSISASLADNEWTRVLDYDPNYDYDSDPDRRIPVMFGQSADQILGSKVPDSPQTMWWTEIAYRSDNWSAYANYNYWDDYYVLFDNDGSDIVGLNDDSTLPTFSEVGIGITYFWKVRTGSSLAISLRGSNITGHEHYNDARYSRDFGRPDGSGPYLGVTQGAEDSWYATLDWTF
ncbi:MAG: TonB-dependent receptor [Acidobacteriota bacterium]|nr:TonB-dependent receptor [Acidobacteriota bacterium]